MNKTRLQELAGIPLTEATSETQEESAEKNLYNEIRRRVNGIYKELDDAGIKNRNIDWLLLSIREALSELYDIHKEKDRLIATHVQGKE